MERAWRRARQWDRADLTAQLAKIDYHTGGWGQRGVEPFGGGGASLSRQDVDMHADKVMKAREAQMQSLESEFSQLEQKLLDWSAGSNSIEKRRKDSREALLPSSKEHALASAAFSDSTRSGPVSSQGAVADSEANASSEFSPSSKRSGQVCAAAGGGGAMTPERNIPTRAVLPRAKATWSALPIAEHHSPVAKSTSIVVNACYRQTLCVWNVERVRGMT